MLTEDGFTCSDQDLSLEEFGLHLHLIKKLEKRIVFTLSEFTNLRQCAIDCLRMVPEDEQWLIEQAIGNIRLKVQPKDYDSSSSLLALEHLIYDEGIISDSRAIEGAA